MKVRDIMSTKVQTIDMNEMAEAETHRVHV